jgi:hypothetical protein
MISDALAPTFGDDSIRIALIAFSPGYVWAAVHVLLAARTVAADVSAAQNADKFSVAQSIKH